MRHKRHRVLIGIGCTLLLAGIIGYGFAFWMGSRPAVVTLTVPKHELVNGLLTVTVIANNTGPTALIMRGDPPFSEVRFQTPSGWTNVSPAYISKQSSIRYLLPGRSQTYQFTVPYLGPRFQVGGGFESAGARSSLAGHLLESGWWNRLAPVSGLVLRCLPDGTRANLVFWSPEIEAAPKH